MVILKRRRLYIWLIKAYLKKWGKTILFSFALGLIAFFIIRSSFSYIVNMIPFIQHKEIGMIGTYTTDSLPFSVLEDVSMGLTKNEKDGTVTPGIASSWEIKDEGKTYIFKLKKNLFFSDNTPLTSEAINYNFKDVALEKPDKHTLVFKLKEPYAPFLITLSQPVYKENFIGVGEYKIKKIDINGDFVQGLKLEDIKNKSTINFQFYPTEEALKMAFVLGEVSKISGIQDVSFKNTSISKFKNASVSKKTDYQTLVSIFYNTQDSLLSDKKLRKALDYSLPDIFEQGERNHTPYSPDIWVNKGEVNSKFQDLKTAKELFKEAKEVASESAVIKIELKSLRKHEKIAKEIQKTWSEILGVDVKVEIVDQRPDNFQAFLGEYSIPKDPDQYSLWHSDQQNNITRYKNLRIDKLLEDGRKTIDNEKRRSIYLDFQKYLLDDVPASFLINPYVFEVLRK